MMKNVNNFNKYIEHYQYIGNYSLVECAKISEEIDINYYNKFRFLFPDVKDIDSIVKRKYKFNHDDRMCYEIDYKYHNDIRYIYSTFVVPVDYVENTLRLKKLERILEDQKKR